MSNIAMDWAVRQAIRGPAKAVLLALANRHNSKTGRCDPCLETLAFDAGVAVSTVKVALQRLMEAGLLSLRRRRKAGKQTSSAFWLHLDVLIEKALQRVSGGDLRSRETAPVRSRETAANRNSRTVREDYSQQKGYSREEPVSVGDTRDRGSSLLADGRPTNIVTVDFRRKPCPTDASTAGSLDPRIHARTPLDTTSSTGSRPGVATTPWPPRNGGNG